MSRKEKIKSEFEQWKSEKTELLSEDWIESLEITKDSTSITWKIDLDFNGMKCCSLMVPETFPKGEYTYFGMNDMQMLRGSLYDVLSKLFTKFEKKRIQFLRDCETPGVIKGEDLFDFDVDEDDLIEEDNDFLSPEEPMTPGGSYSFDVVGFEEENSDQNAKILETLIDEVNKHNNSKGWYAKMSGCGIDNVRIYLMIKPYGRLHISDLVANCWCIDLSKYLIISLTFSSFCLSGSLIPEIESFQAGKVSLNCLQNPGFLQNDRRKYGLWWTTCNRLKNEFFKKTPMTKEGKVKKTGENFLIASIKFAENVIKSSPYFCLICGGHQQHVGIKPAVCEKSLCIFSHEEYGLGCDLESTIINNADIVDLLVTITVSAAAAPTTRYNPFTPYPFGIEVKKRDQHTGQIIRLNFVTHDNKKDNSKILSVVSKIPSVRDGKLKSELDKIDCRMYGLLRWIITSNRTHLHRLGDSKKLSVMKTEQQYILMSGTPQKEMEFQALKKKHGSVLAWHGSPLYNWHSILRTGLKNMSGTKGQLHGAAHGKGVYFAPNSSTSTGYMKMSMGWSNSSFHNSNLGMMALCEIIKHQNYKMMPKPFYVIPEEKHIQTRLFFVYSQQNRVSVLAKNLKIPEIKFY